MRLRTRPFPIPHPSRSRGSVLAVVLVVLVVMMLGGVSLLRSVDTSALLSGNLAFKRDSVNRTSVGLNKAFETMQRYINGETIEPWVKNIDAFYDKSNAAQEVANAY